MGPEGFCRCMSVAGDLPRHLVSPRTVASIPDPIPVGSEILAWRGWLVECAETPCQLASVAHAGYRWDGPIVHADEIPTATNANGLYARKTFDAIIGEYDAPVLGEVALSGIVVEGERGYRAQTAAIRSLYLNVNGQYPRGPLLLADELEQRYQCPVTLATWQPKPQLYGLSGWSSASTMVPYVAVRAGQTLKVDATGNYWFVDDAAAWSPPSVEGFQGNALA